MALYFGDNNGKARLAQKIYIGIPQVTLTNLIPQINGSDGWSNGTSSTTYTKYSNQSILLTSTANDAEVTTNTIQKIPLIAGHKYYIRVEVYFPSSTSVRRTSCYWPIAEPSVWNSSQLNLSLGPNQWHLLGMITDRSVARFTTGEYEFRIDFDNDKKAGQMWIDGVMCIDLTAAFGLGKEPNQGWCNENIPYFYGTTNLIYDGATSLAVPVKKAYLGVNGKAQLIYTQ